VNSCWRRTLLFVLIIYGFSCFKQTLNSEPIGKARGRIIAFDLHGVVLTYDWMKFVPTIMHFNHKWDLIKNLYKLPMRSLFPLMLAWPSFEQFLDTAGRGNNALRDFLIDLSVQQKVIPETAHLIQYLHDNGCTLHVLSNIGASSFDLLRRKFNDVFSNFSFVMTSDPRQHNGKLRRKPDSTFYKDYLEAIKEITDDPADIIFVDDSAKNVAAARALGMNAIQFKDAQQLTVDLTNLGLMTRD